MFFARNPVRTSFAAIAVLLAASSLNSFRPSAQAQTPISPQPAGRVILASFDGLGYRIWKQDPVAGELTALGQLAKEGVTAEGMQAAFPSTTGNSHCALWTGAYGNVSGISANSIPLLPRAAHTFLERTSGFLSDGLMAEPIWAAAGRQGIRVVAHQTPQGYPFRALNTVPDAATPPVVVNGYQTRLIAPATAVRPQDVTWEDAAIWSPPLPGKPRCFRWKAGQLTFHGALVSAPDTANYGEVVVAADPKADRVRVRAAALESGYSGSRDLARGFSEPLPLTSFTGMPSAGVFRLFELTPDGGFLLYQATVQELAVFDRGAGSDTSAQMVRELGPFVPNGAHDLYRRGTLGKQIYAGGDGTAERRYLETVELVTRQFNRYTRYLWNRFAPRLLVDYFPYPDEVDHTWLGLAQQGGATGARFDEMRRWGYRLVNTRMELLRSLLGARDYLVVVSDHGMTPVSKGVKINLALAQGGLLARNDSGAFDAARSQAINLRSGILLNTAEWKSGAIAGADREKALLAVEEALRRVKDPASGAPVFTAFFRPENSFRDFGSGGPAGADLYFDLAPGYEESAGMSGPVVEPLEPPTGAHGFFPLRPEMLAVFIAGGPSIPKGATRPRMKSIEVAPFVSKLLGIEPPAQATRPAIAP